MGSFGDYAEDKIIDHITGKTSFTKPTAYVAASTADPTDDASGIAEPSGNNYARVTTSGSTWNASSGGSTTNASAITFPTASGSWGTITHFAIYDASSGGNMLAHGALDSSQSITTNQILQFDADGLTITLT